MKKVYILSGLGVDKRVFNNFNLPFCKRHLFKSFYPTIYNDTFHTNTYSKLTGVILYLLDRLSTKCLNSTKTSLRYS